VDNIEEEKKYLELFWLCEISSSGNFAGSQENLTDWIVHTKGCNSIIQITCSYTIEAFFMLLHLFLQIFFHFFCSSVNSAFLLILQWI